MFEIFGNLAVTVFLSTSFNDKFIKSLSSGERKRVPSNFPPRPILTAYKAKTNYTTRRREETIATLIIAHEFSQELVQAALTVTLKWLFEASVLFATNVKVIVQLDTSTELKKGPPVQSCTCMMDVYQQITFFVVAAGASSSVTKIAEHQRTATTSRLPSEILNGKTEEYFLHTSLTRPVNFVNIIHFTPATDYIQ